MRQRLAELLDILMGFRKMIAFFLVVMIAIVFRVINLIDGPGFVDLAKNVTLAFFAGNSVEHFTAMAKNYWDNKSNMAGVAPKTPDTPPQDNP